MKQLLYTIPVFLLFACSTNCQGTNFAGPAQKLPAPDTLTGISGNKVVFVISREGAVARKEPAEDAELLKMYSYGDMVLLAGETDDWYRVSTGHA